MSITEVRNQGYEDNTSATTYTVNPPAAGFASGNLLIAGFQHEDEATPPTFTDSDTNTWTRVATQQMPGGETMWIHIYFAVLSANLISTDTVTATWLTAVRPRILLLREFNSSTGWPADPRDGTPAQTSGTGTSMAVGPTGTTSQAETLSVAVFGVDGNTATFTGDATFTGGVTYGGSFTGSQGDEKGYSQYLVNSSAGTNSITVTRSAGTIWWAGILANFKTNAAGGSTGLPTLVMPPPVSTA